MEGYTKISMIGRGSFGEVWKVQRNSDNKFFVWKELNYGKMNEMEKEQLVDEVNILRELKHHHIVRYVD
jgi:NIMA (never in mitosis gene a)-related kinase 2